MRWTPGQNSDDVEDRRDESDSGGGGGFRGGMPLGIGGFVLLLVLSLVFKTNFFALLDNTGGGASVPTTASRPSERSPDEEKLKEFVTFVLDDAQDTWTKLLPSQGVPYQHAKLVLFRDSIRSACGTADAASGPFYCPGDRKVYIDLGFYSELRNRFGAPGEFAEAYVSAHELGHHVQKLLGIEDRVRRAQEANPRQANALSVRVELQADCLAGVWGHSTAGRNILEPGDLESGLNAAAAIGDDRLQKMGGGRVSPETFTHGSSAQRVSWFKRGFDTGNVSACDTFASRQ
jgi:uncharacterized protein